ncbi:MAG: hypothetical protein U0802_11930 [Candidatus Binatia bacterium]
MSAIEDGREQDRDREQSPSGTHAPVRQHDRDPETENDQAEPALGRDGERATEPEPGRRAARPLAAQPARETVQARRGAHDEQDVGRRADGERHQLVVRGHHERADGEPGARLVGEQDREPARQPHQDRAGDQERQTRDHERIRRCRRSRA